MILGSRICAVPCEESHKFRGDECCEREAHFAHSLLIPYLMGRRNVEMDRLPDAQSNGDDAALIDRPSASGCDIRMPHAFCSAVAAVEDKHRKNGRTPQDGRTVLQMLISPSTPIIDAVNTRRVRSEGGSASSRPAHSCMIQPCSASTLTPFIHQPQSRQTEREYLLKRHSILANSHISRNRARRANR